MSGHDLGSGSERFAGDAINLSMERIRADAEHPQDSEVKMFSHLAESSFIAKYGKHACKV
jgi:hypothetical protein